MIDTIIFDVGRVLVNWDYESYLKRFAFGPEKTKAITAATFESPYWRQFDRGILTPEEIVKGFCSLAPEYTEEIGTGDLPAPDPEILPHPGPLRIPRRHQSKRRGRRAGRDSWNSFYGI